MSQCRYAGRVARVDQLTKAAIAIQYLSSGAKSGHDEDHIGVFSTAGLLDVLVIDGRTSVADQDYIDPVHGDVAWFVQS